MDFKEMNKVSNWGLRVYEQTKIDSANGNKMVRMRCIKSGKKIEDGKYEDPMFIDVLVTKDTTWGEMDYTKKNILVSGDFSHSFYTAKSGETRMSFTIFASEIKENVR